MDPGWLEKQELDGVQEISWSGATWLSGKKTPPTARMKKRAATTGIATAEDGPCTGTTGGVMRGGCDANNGPSCDTGLLEAHQSSKLANISSCSFRSITQRLFLGCSVTETADIDVTGAATANVMAHTADDKAEVVTTLESADGSCPNGTGIEGEKPEKEDDDDLVFVSYL